MYQFSVLKSGHWGLFQKDATQILQSLWNAELLNDTHLLGLSWDEFQGFTAVPWNEARLCGLLKEIPTAHIPLMIFSKG